MKLATAAIVGVGGYFALKYFMGVDLLGGLIGTHIDTHPAGTTTQSGQGTVQANATISPDIKSLVSAAMAASQANPNGMNSADIYNWYYQNKVRGIAAPAPEILFPGQDRNRLYTLDEWWTAMVGKGFSGMYSYHGMQGMGMVSRMNPWVNHFTPGPGRTILPLASETFIRSFGN